MEKRPRPRLAAAGAALVGGVLSAALALILIALPLFFFASATEPDKATGRPFVRTGLVDVAIPFAAVVGCVGGGLAARWRLRGGRLGREDEGDRWS